MTEQKGGRVTICLRTNEIARCVEASEDFEGLLSHPGRTHRLHGLIERTPHTLRYRVTDFGLRSALVLTRVHSRFLTTVMAEVANTGPPHPSPLGRALHTVGTEIDRVATRTLLAAAA